MVKAIEKMRILVTPKSVRKLAREFGTTDVTIYASLRYERNGERAKKIRSAAIERYEGVEVKMPMLV